MDPYPYVEAAATDHAIKAATQTLGAVPDDKADGDRASTALANLIRTAQSDGDLHSDISVADIHLLFFFRTHRLSADDTHPLAHRRPLWTCGDCLPGTFWPLVVEAQRVTTVLKRQKMPMGPSSEVAPRTAPS